MISEKFFLFTAGTLCAIAILQKNYSAASGWAFGALCEIQIIWPVERGGLK